MVFFLCCSFKLSELHCHPNFYKFLDDNILHILYVSDDPRLEETQKLIKKLKTRELYDVYMSHHQFKVTTSC